MTQELITKTIGHKRMSKSRLEAPQPKRGTEVRTPTQRTNPTDIFAIFTYFLFIALDITFFGRVSLDRRHPLIVPDLGLRENRPVPDFLLRRVFKNIPPLRFTTARRQRLSRRSPVHRGLLNYCRQI